MGKERYVFFGLILMIVLIVSYFTETGQEYLSPTNKMEFEEAYGVIWEHMSEAERSVYTSKWEFYKEFREQELEGNVKYHPEEGVIIYGKGPSVYDLNIMDMDVHDGLIYTVNSGNGGLDRIIAFDQDGNFVKKWGNRKMLYYPFRLAVDANFIYALKTGGTCLPNRSLSQCQPHQGGLKLRRKESRPDFPRA